jgi:hypothetical protein
VDTPKTSDSHERFRAAAHKHGLEIVDMPLVPSALPDGGRIDITDPTIVAMGDVFTFRQLTYSHDGDRKRNRPACRVVFEVRNGVPVCARISLWSDGETPIRAKDLNSIRIDNLRDDLYAYTGVFVRNPDGDDHEYVRRLGWSSFQQDRKLIERVPQRRKITPELLRRVAEIHKAAPDGGRLVAIKAAFKVKERQALRYIDQARREGLIDG